MSAIDINVPVIEWLLTGMSNELPPEAFLRQFAHKLRDSGVPVSRIAFFVRSLHPTIMGRSFMWEKGKGVTVNQAGHDVVAQDAYLKSPIVQIYRRSKDWIRSSLVDEEDLEKYPVLRELKDEGATDYMIYGLSYLNGETHAVSFTCFDESGFSEDNIALINACRLPISRIAEIYTLRRTATTLLDTYLGHGTGERVLKGQIKRGDGDRIEAVVCFCDLRRSSSLAEEQGMEGFLETLNEFYDATAAPIIENGGEVLRFIGDAYLGIFQLDAFENAETACRAALKAASEGQANLEALSAARIEAGKSGLEGGFGLHIGEVMYGNIGTAERLEFTVIGTTANEAARLESQCKNLSEPILVSQEFAQAMKMKWRDLGAYNARNISRPMHLYAPG